MEEFVSFVQSATIRAARLHQEDIRKDTLQGFLLTMAAFFVVGLLAIRLQHSPLTITDPGISSIDIVDIPSEKPYIAPETRVQARSEVGDRFIGRPDSVPTLNLSVNDVNKSLTTSTGSNSINTSNGGGEPSRSTSNGVSTSTTQTSYVEPDFDAIPEVDAQVNLSALQGHIEYPEMMRRLGVSGTVVVVVAINEQGRAVRARIESTTESGFNNAAIKAVMQTTFTPARNGGQAVPSSLAIPIRFKMN